MKRVSQSYPVRFRFRNGVRACARRGDGEAWDKQYRILAPSHRRLNRMIGPFASPVQQMCEAFIDHNRPCPDMPKVLAGSRT
jgi:hypothetical protein